MRKSSLQPFPPESTTGVWPLLIISPKIRAVKERRQSKWEKRWHRQLRIREMLLRDVMSAIPKGAVIGLSSFSLVFCFVPFSAFWLSQWHWVMLLGSILFLRILVGTNFTCLITVLGAFCVSLGTLIKQPTLLLIFMGVGIIFRCTAEILPK